MILKNGAYWEDRFGFYYRLERGAWLFTSAPIVRDPTFAKPGDSYVNPLGQSYTLSEERKWIIDPIVFRESDSFLVQFDRLVGA